MMRTGANEPADSSFAPARLLARRASADDRPALFGRMLFMPFQFRRNVCCALVAAWCSVVSSFADEGKRPAPAALPPSAVLQKLTVLPSEAVLSGPRASQRLVVLGHYSDGRQWDLTRQATWTSSDPARVKFEQGTAWPVADGTARLQVKVGTHEAEVQ